MSIRSIHSVQKHLALTFDDGPDRSFTPQVLDILAQYAVPATFFCLGSQVNAFPEVLRRMHTEGHTIANHTWSHPYLTRSSVHDLVWEVQSTSDLIHDISGCRPRFFRPPYGDTDASVEEQIALLGYQSILWSVDSTDWSGISGPEVAARVIPHLHPGAIVLHHSAGHVAGTVAALPYLIEVTRALGYEYVRLEDMLGQPAYQ
ncbi:MAG: polysaccharide deacetylase family protein [Firmicutes bacterium]|nr:polysaccharide deacetylase family protein [Bacillota bacterium]